MKTDKDISIEGTKTNEFRNVPSLDEIERLQIENRELKWANQHWSDYIKTKVEGGAALQESKEELAGMIVEVNRLRSALVTARDQLINLQPHIPQACKQGHEPFIDSHVDAALEAINSGLANEQSADKLTPKKPWCCISCQQMNSPEQIECGRCGCRR